MKTTKIAVGDTVVLKGKQGIVEAFYKGDAIVYLIENQERHVATVKTLNLCKDKYEAMTTATEEING